MIFGNIEFWHPNRAEGRQKLTAYRMDLKIVSKRSQRILMNLQLLFECILLAIFVTNSIDVLWGALCGHPPTLFRVKHNLSETTDMILCFKSCFKKSKLKCDICVRRNQNKIGHPDLHVLC